MKQIESGAPADAFVPVDLKWMDYDVEKKVTGWGHKGDMALI
jgi:ABC-type molybdate transport system substrate-binding protein